MAQNEACSKMNHFYSEFVPYLATQSVTLEKSINEDNNSPLDNYFNSESFIFNQPTILKNYIFKLNADFLNSHSINKFIENSKKICAKLEVQTNLEKYKSENKTLKAGNSILDNGIVFDLNVNVNTSIISHGCKIGKKSRIINSIISKNVQIQDNTTITNSIILPNETIERGKIFKSEIIPSQNQLKIFGRRDVNI